MPGTLLVFDQNFPRSRAATGDMIINRPRVAELMAEGYPAPHRLLPIAVSSNADQYVPQIAQAARSLSSRIDVLIIFAHGQVTSAYGPAGVMPVMTGILLGSNPIAQDNADLLRCLRPRFARGAHCELWVCQAASPTATSPGRGSTSGHNLCQAIADALRIPVQASASDQQTTTMTGAGTFDSEIDFLPWEGPVETFRPNL
ncbi:MAG: hypothetical protein ABI434_16470 [Burkholderiaceae bacterium]